MPKNQPKTSDKIKISARIDSFDYKCLQLLAHETDRSVSSQLSLIIKSVTQQTKTLFTEQQLDKALAEVGISTNAN